MPFCPNCGTRLSEDARFCAACGTRLSLPAEPAESAPVQEAPVQDASYQAPAYQAPYEQPQAQPYEQPQTQPYQQPQTQPYGQPQAQSYEQPQTQPYGQYPYQEQPQFQAPLTQKAPAKPKRNAGKIIAVFAVAAILIAAAVVFFATRSSSDGLVNEGPKWIVYEADDAIFAIDQNGKNLTKVVGADESRRSTVRLSRDKKSVFYGDHYEDGVYDLYLRKIGDDGEADEPVLKGISNYMATGKDGWILYQKNGSVYACDIDDPDGKVKLASEDGSLIAGSTDGLAVLISDDGKLYRYAVGEKEREKIASDASPENASDDLKTVIYVRNDALYFWQTGDEEGKKIASDASVEEVSEDRKTVIYTKDSSLYFWKAGDEEGTKIASDVTRVTDFCEEAERVFYSKEEAFYTVKFGGEPEKIASDAVNTRVYDNGHAYVFSRGGEEENYSVIYYNGKESVSVKKDVFILDLDEVSAAIEDEDNFECRLVAVSNEGENEYYLLYQGEWNPIGKGFYLVEDAEVTSDLKTLYFIGKKDEGDDRALYSCAFSGGKPGEAEKYESDVSSFTLIGDTPRFAKEDELYFGKEKIASGVDHYGFTDYEKKTFCYLINENEDKTLYFFDGKAKKVDDDVSWDSIVQMENGNLFYQKDLSSSGTGDLYLYSGSSERIAKDVSGFSNLY